MKVILQLFFLLTLLLSVQIVTAQRHPILDKLDIYESGGKVFITCIISAGNTCNGINVLRSTDSIEFSIIGNVSGVCGSNEFPITYDFVDESPVINKPMYYQLEFGGFAPTEIIRLLIIDYNSNGYQVRPQPANEEARIYFKNPFRTEYLITLFSNSGNTILQEKTSGEFFDLNLIDIPSGLYGFRISNNPLEPAIVGKLIIQH